MALGQPRARLALGGGPLRDAAARRHAGRRVYDLLRPIALSGKHATVKVPGAAITAVLEWARINEFPAEGSPVETVRRGLPRRAGGPKHHDPVHWSEMGAALARIDAGQWFTTLTAARQVEARRAAWVQFDLEAAVWTKPA